LRTAPEAACPTAAARAATHWTVAGDTLRRPVAALRVRLLRRFSPNWRRYLRTRRRLAERHLGGSGLEIGALHMPLPLPEGASARYVDHKTLPELRRDFPELDGVEIVSPDIVDDGASLRSVADESVDFVIANHFVEHCEDPIGALEQHCRVLRPGGILYVALPDRRRQELDRGRDPVPISHHVRDHLEGPGWSRERHYEEWVRAADIPLGLVAPGDVDSAVTEHLRRHTAIHFHAWSRDEFLALIEYCRGTWLPLAVREAIPNVSEFIVILEKNRSDA
jgi:SAM-dependent methyltransferase